MAIIGTLARFGCKLLNSCYFMPRSQQKPSQFDKLLPAMSSLGDWFYVSRRGRGGAQPKGENYMAMSGLGPQ